MKPVCPCREGQGLASWADLWQMLINKSVYVLHMNNMKPYHKCHVKKIIQNPDCK